jgi:hypothetical protein
MMTTTVNIVLTHFLHKTRMGGGIGDSDQFETSTAVKVRVEHSSLCQYLEHHIVDVNTS